MKTKFWPMLLLLAFMASGCTNTFRGAGEDIERGGQKIQEKTR